MRQRGAMRAAVGFSIHIRWAAAILLSGAALAACIYNFDNAGAYTAGALLAAISICVLLVMTATAPDKRRL